MRSVCVTQQGLWQLEAVERSLATIENSRFFEYYIVDKELNWMVAENDHGDLLFIEASN